MHAVDLGAPDDIVVFEPAVNRPLNQFWQLPLNPIDWLIDWWIMFNVVFGPEKIV